MLSFLENDKRPLLLVVDDEPVNLSAMRQILNEDYRLTFATSGIDALKLAREQKPNLVLLDIVMEGMNGFDTAKEFKADPSLAHIPIIFVTVLSDAQDEEEGFAVGGVDYILKPVKPALVRARVKTHLSLVRMDDLHESRQQILMRLGRAAEFKDDETSGHIMRVSYYAHSLAVKAGAPEDWAQDLLSAAPMHDVGKIGVPDAILNAPRRLDSAEWEVVARHPLMGAAIIGEHPSQLLKMSYNVALQHHERWDGTGYPQGLEGEEIAPEARIVALADVFDALTSERPYKRAWDLDSAFGLIEDELGRHFDPHLGGLFIEMREEIVEIMNKYADAKVPALDLLAMVEDPDFASRGPNWFRHRIQGPEA